MQHDIRILPNGNITIFDNGEQFNPQSSRAVEYEIDEESLTAKKVWEYKPNPKIFTPNAGSAQRLNNGNTIIGWGNTNAVSPKRDITETDQNGNIVFEMALPANNITFKALKFPYPLIQASAIVSRQELYPSNTYVFDKDNQKTGVTFIYKHIEGSFSMYNTLKITKFIKWAMNIDDPVKIELLRNNQSILSISDSLVSYTGAFAWVIPSNVPNDSTYKIKISSLKDPKISTISKENFSIIRANSVNSQKIDKLFVISPNPAKDYIDINSHSASWTKEEEIKIYNTYGDCVIDLAPTPLLKGEGLRIDVSHLPTGVYFIKIGKETTMFVKM